MLVNYKTNYKTIPLKTVHNARMKSWKFHGIWKSRFGRGLQIGGYVKVQNKVLGIDF